MEEFNLWKELLGKIDVKEASQEHSFKIGEVTFEIDPHDAWSAWKQLDKIRAKLSNLVVSGNVAGLLALEHKFLMENVFDNLKEKTYFVTPAVKKGRLKLAGNEQMAFNREFGMQPEHVYELMGRWLAINFTNSCSGIASLLGKLLDSSEQEATNL